MQVYPPYIYVPVDNIHEIGKWNIECNSSGTGQVCCYAWAGSIVGHVQCVGGVTNPLRLKSHLIESAIAEAQTKARNSIIQPMRVRGKLYVYDGIQNDRYRFKLSK